MSAASLEATLALFDGDFSNPYSYSGFADLGRAALEPLRVMTLDGKPIAGWELATESGALYNVPVPEPGTAALVMAALAGLVAHRRRR